MQALLGKCRTICGKRFPWCDGRTRREGSADNDWNLHKRCRAESRRDGAPPIDLIDGDRLCELLKEYAIGVTTTPRVVEDVAIDTDYFKSLEPK